MGNELATNNNNLAALFDNMELRKQIASVMPQELDAKRFMKIAIAAATRTPGLMFCTQESLLKCLMDLSSMGLEPDGRRAHLIPYGKTCTLVIDYKGLADLARRSGEVKTIQCAVVYQKELDEKRFVLEYGSNAKLVHQPILVGERGDVIGAYSCVMMANGEESFHWMRKDEIDAIRKRSKASGNGPWVTDYNEMAKKTVFRQHTKLLPFSAETREKMEADDKYLYEHAQSNNGTAAAISGSLNDRIKGNLEAAKTIDVPAEPSEPMVTQEQKLQIEKLIAEIYPVDTEKALSDTIGKGGWETVTESDAAQYIARLNGELQEVLEMEEQAKAEARA